MGNKSTKTGSSKEEDRRAMCNGVEEGTEASKLPQDVPFDRYCFPFENIVFEGGGSKGLAYCGAVRVSALTSIQNK